MEQFKVKVVKAELSSYWYADKIGQVFDVSYCENPYYYCLINGIKHTISFSDCVRIEETYDFINPNHYKQGEKETWEMMLEIWGKEAFITHCQMTAYKYMQRLGKKPDNPIEQDLKKAKWYLDKAQELLNS
jgi:chitinase